MENFTNETIDTAQLPKFEQVVFTDLHKDYWKVVLSNLFLLFLLLGCGLGLGFYNIEEWMDYRVPIIGGSVLFIILTLFFSRIGFKKKGFAFRQHDVLYRYGIIATSTIVIPYNRIQHVSLHEGLVSRYFGLAKIEIFTAGGNSGDIEIPGIEKEQAESIKQLLMGKIQKQL